MNSKKRALEEQITRKFVQMLNCEIGYPSIASNEPMKIVGLGHKEIPQTPDDFKGPLVLEDEVDKLFYHFPVRAILLAMSEHIQTKAMGEDDNISEREMLVEISAVLKQYAKRLRN